MLIKIELNNKITHFKTLEARSFIRIRATVIIPTVTVYPIRLSF